MGKIFWYVLRKFGQNFLLCMSTVLTIYLVVDFFEKLRKFLKYDADLSLMLSFFVYRIPEITFLLAPLGALMASILTIGGLNRTREITAMRSCGLSFYQISVPFFAFGLFVSAIGFGLTAVFIPLANLKAEYVIDKVLYYFEDKFMDLATKAAEKAIRAGAIGLKGAPGITVEEKAVTKHRRR